MQSCEFLCRRFAEVADAHGEEPALEGFGFGCVESGDHLGRVFFAEATRGVVGAEVEVGEGFFG